VPRPFLTPPGWQSPSFSTQFSTHSPLLLPTSLTCYPEVFFNIWMHSCDSLSFAHTHMCRGLPLPDFSHTTQLPHQSTSHFPLIMHDAHVKSERKVFSFLWQTDKRHAPFFERPPERISRLDTVFPAPTAP